MNPLLLALLAGGGFAAYKLLQKPVIKVNADLFAAVLRCPTADQAPPNPFFDAAGGVDWDALKETLGAHKNNKSVQKWLGYAAQGGSAASMVPGLNWVGAGVAAASIALAQISDWLAEDENNDEYKKRAQNAASELAGYGYIPVTYWQGATFKQLGDANTIRIWALNKFEPYINSLTRAGGVMFKTWGGYGEVGLLAMPTLADTHMGNAPVMGGFFYDNQEKAIAANAQALPSVAASIAVSMGRCHDIQAVVDAAIAANANWMGYYPGRVMIQGPYGARLFVDETRAAGLLANAASKKASTSGPFKKGVKTTQQTSSADELNRMMERTSPEANFSVYAYAAGLWAAIDKASELAGAPRPKPMNRDILAVGWETIPTLEPERQTLVTAAAAQAVQGVSSGSKASALASMRNLLQKPKV